MNINLVVRSREGTKGACPPPPPPPCKLMTLSSQIGDDLILLIYVYVVVKGLCPPQKNTLCCQLKVLPPKKKKKKNTQQQQQTNKQINPGSTTEICDHFASGMIRMRYRVWKIDNNHYWTKPGFNVPHYLIKDTFTPWGVMRHNHIFIKIETVILVTFIQQLQFQNSEFIRVLSFSFLFYFTNFVTSFTF